MGGYFVYFWSSFIFRAFLGPMSPPKGAGGKNVSMAMRLLDYAGNQQYRSELFKLEIEFAYGFDLN